MVLGYALESQYELTIDLVETQRELRPAAALALGQASHAALGLFTCKGGSSQSNGSASMCGHTDCVNGGTSTDLSASSAFFDGASLTLSGPAEALKKLLLTGIGRRGRT